MRAPLLPLAALLALAGPMSAPQADNHAGGQAVSSIQAPAPAMAVSALEAALLQVAPTLRPEALRAALASWQALQAAGEIARPLLTVIDYSLPSTAKRLWVFDMEERRLLFHELVAHGRGSGEDMATAFSNVEGSLMTSLGAFLTGVTYHGRNGYSLRLRGMDPGINDLAEARAIVMHAAPYVSEAWARRWGRLGRSWGCPALRPEIARAVIDTIKERSMLYAWHPGSAPAMAAATP
jgi:hypothetical protein